MLVHMHVAIITMIHTDKQTHTLFTLGRFMCLEMIKWLVQLFKSIPEIDFGDYIYIYIYSEDR